MVQDTPCDVWDYANGFTFEHLTAGVEMTLRASASGYVDLERTVMPSAGPQTAVIFPLARQ